MTVRCFPRPRVLQRIPLDRPTVIEASAGTGKTFTLEHLVVEILLATNTPIERILVVTFTEKATRELRSRLRAKLTELTRTDEGTDESLATSEGDVFRIGDQARETLTKALRALDVATIATIHAFCQRVLQENAFSSGRLFDEHHVDAREAFALAFRDALRRAMAPEDAEGAWLRAAVPNGLVRRERGGLHVGLHPIPRGASPNGRCGGALFGARRVQRRRSPRRPRRGEATSGQGELEYGQGRRQASRNACGRG